MICDPLVSFQSKSFFFPGYKSSDISLLTVHFKCDSDISLGASSVTHQMMQIIRDAMAKGWKASCVLCPWARSVPYKQNKSSFRDSVNMLKLVKAVTDPVFILIQPHQQMLYIY